MHAMQYEIALPADYDMDIIRKRVEARGHLLDQADGLGVKVYAIRERGVDDSPVNQYSPFYLWRELAGMNTFLWEGGFSGIVESFGRPVVQHWTGLAFEEGDAIDADPQAASKHVEIVPTEASPAEYVTRAIEDLREHARRPDVHSAALAVDARGWQLMRYTLWRDTAPKDDDVRYQVLHTSTPQLPVLRRGRHW